MPSRGLPKVEKSVAYGRLMSTRRWTTRLGFPLISKPNRSRLERVVSTPCLRVGELSAGFALLFVKKFDNLRNRQKYWNFK
jgi:hypothetical protein